MYEDVQDAGPTQEQLTNISALANKQLDLERELGDAEKIVAELSRKLRQVSERDLPEAMAEAGCKAFTLSSGYSVKIKEDISASLSADKKPAACEWLRGNGYGDIVKEDISVSFGRGEEERAVATATALMALGLAPKVVTDVNTATLKALIRELLEKGIEVPLETLGAYQWRKAVIKHG